MKRKIVNSLAILIIGAGFTVSGMAATTGVNGGVSVSPNATCTDGNGDTCSGSSCSAGGGSCKAN